MAFKEVSRVEITEIIRRWQAGAGVRGLARATGLSRNTAKKYVKAAEKCGLTRDGPPPSESQLMELIRLNLAGPRQRTRPAEDVLRPWAERIQQWVQTDHLRLTRIHEILGQQHCVMGKPAGYPSACWREESGQRMP